MYGAGFDVEYSKDVPADVQREATANALTVQRTQLRASEALAEEIAQLSSEYDRKLAKIVGGDHLKRYFNVRPESKEKLRQAIDAGEASRSGEKRIAKLRRKIVKQSRSYLDEIGFDDRAALKLRGKYEAKIRNATAKYLQLPEEPNWVVPPEQVPDDVHNPWAVYGPPYPGWAWSYNWNRSDEPRNPTFSRYLNSSSGELGSYTSIAVAGADNSDYSSVRYRTGVRFWYRIPATGLVEVWMRMQAIHTPYSGWHSDEWGFSGVGTDQESHATLQVISPGPGATRKATILDYRRTGTNANWSREVSQAPTQRWAHLYSLGSFAEGTWLLLETGTEEWNHFWSNDVSVGSYMTQRWFLQNVYVRSTGE